MAKVYKVKVTDLALSQMQEIVAYISLSLQAPDTAKHWLGRMKRELDSLSNFPARVPLTEEEPWYSQGVHKFVVGNHIAYFWIDDDERIVWITAVVYGRRNQREQLSQMEL